MNRRNLLKILPLAAMVGTSVKLGESEAAAHEMKPDKKYVFVVPEITAQDAQRCRKLLQERGVNAAIVSGAEDLKIYELE